jgi:hypothetical protein
MSTTVIAILALTCSIAALCWQFASWRLSGPLVRLRWCAMTADGNLTGVRLRLCNRGRAEAQVCDVGFLVLRPRLSKGWNTLRTREGWQTLATLRPWRGFLTLRTCIGGSAPYHVTIPASRDIEDPIDVSVGELRTGLQRHLADFPQPWKVRAAADLGDDHYAGPKRWMTVPSITGGPDILPHESIVGDEQRMSRQWLQGGPPS